MPSKLFQRFSSLLVFAVLFFISKNSHAAVFFGQVVDESKAAVAQVQSRDCVDAKRRRHRHLRYF